MSDKNNGFNVEAQGYGLGNYIKQYTTPSGLRRAVTESVSSKYKERMETLRDADKGIRETAGNLKDYLKNAQKAFKDNRYLDVAHWCAQINGAIIAMIQEGKPVVDLRDAEIAEFYTRYEDAEPDYDYFSSADDGLVSTAGILDSFFGNSIEKLYWKKVKESKLAVQSLIKKAEKLVAIVLSCLGRMGDARAKGNIADWIEELQRIGKAQAEFQIFARGIYDKHLKQLAEIVRANKPKPSAQTNVQRNSIPEAEKAEEVEELVEIPITEESPIYENKPEAVVQKREPGRPTIDEAAKKKEMEQIEQLQSLLNNPISAPAPAPVVEESKPIEEVKIEEPKVDNSIKSEPAKEIKPVEPPKVETPKVVNPVSTQKPVLAPAPPAPASTQKPIEQKPVSTPIVTSPAPEGEKRGRGRPRKYPVGQSPTDIRKREMQERKNQLNRIVNPEVPKAPTEDIKTPVETIVPEVSFEATAPSISAPKPQSVSTKPDANKILNRIKNELTPPSKPERTVDLHKPTIEKPPENSDKKMTMVLLPKIKPDNLDKVKILLEKDLGHPVQFVTQDSGKEIATEYHKAGWDIQGMEWSEVKEIEDKYKINPLDLLDNQAYLDLLPRLGNGTFDKRKIFDNDDFELVNGKLVSAESYPEFKNLDEKTRKEVVEKLKKLEEDPKNIILPNDVAKLKQNNINTEEATKEIKPEEIKQEKENIKAPEKSKVSDFEKELELIPSDEEDEMKIYEHSIFLEKLLDKPVSKLTETDVRQLQWKQEYYDSLPRMKNNKVNMDLIRKFPEIKLLKEEDPQFLKAFLKGIENSSRKINDPNAWKDQKSKSAVSVEDTVVKYSHQKFFNELQKVANIEDYGLMAAMMCAYSEEIESIDPITSIKLIRAAEKLI